MEAKLVLIRGSADRSEVPLQLPVMIGRHKTASVLIHDPMVSRQHCELYENRGRLFVRDLDSANGTWVNGRPARLHLLKPGDKVTLGSLTFRADYEMKVPSLLQTQALG